MPQLYWYRSSELLGRRDANNQIVAYSIGVASCAGGPPTIPVLVVEAVVVALVYQFIATQIYTSISFKSWTPHFVRGLMVPMEG